MKSAVLAVVLVVVLASGPVSAEHITWEPTEGPKGGYSRYIVQDSTDEDVIYVGFAPSQVWKSTDGGETWTRRSEGLPAVTYDVASDGISALTIAEGDPQTLYAGTTIGNVYKTTDGAAHWEVVLRTPDETGPIGVIEVSPRDSSLVFAGFDNGDFYVSRDGGDSWQEVGDGLDIRGTASGDVAFDPEDPSVVYFAPSFFDVEREGGESGLFKSTDAGVTWRKVGSGLETGVVNGIAIDPRDPDHLYLATGSTFEWGFDTHGLYESTDGGETVTKVGEDFPPFGHAIPFVAFSEDGKRVIVGSHPGLDGDLFISADGGETWKTKTGTWGDFVADVAEFDDPDRLLVTLYWSGLFLTEDGGETWRDVPVAPHSKLHTVYAPGFDADRVYAAAHSNGLFYSDDRGRTWTRVEEGAGGVVHESIIHNYGSSASRYAPSLLWIRGEYSSEVIVLQDVSAPAWTSIPVPGDMSTVLAHPNEPGVAFVGSDRGLFVATVDGLGLEPIDELQGVAVNDLSGDEAAIVVGTDEGVYESADGGGNWRHVGLGGEPVTAAAKSDATTYAAVDGDGVYRSSGDTFERVNELSSVSQIVPDPGDGNTVFFAASDEFDVPRIYFSGDRGETLDLEEFNLGEYPTLDPHKLSFSADGTALYLATGGQGVWRAQVREDPLPVAEPVAWENAPRLGGDGEDEPATTGGERDVQTTTPDGTAATPDASVSTPGFGAGIAILAIFVSMLIAVRRRRR